MFSDNMVPFLESNSIFNNFIQPKKNLSTNSYLRTEEVKVPRERGGSPGTPPVSDAPPTPLTPPPSCRGRLGDHQPH